MDFSLSKSNISNIQNVCDSNISQNIDSDITLPEYVDDIETVLSCSLTPEIESASLSDGKVAVEGSALIRLLYTSQKGTLHCFENTVPFSRFAEAQNVTDSDCLSVTGATQYVNCRLVNPRRFDVHGNIIISFHASEVVSQSVVSSAEGAGIQTRTKCLTVSNARAVTEKPFTLSEVLEINPDLPSIAQMVSISASPYITETKLISGKALVKGDMTLEALYIADDRQNCIQSAQFVLPISQIVELDTTEEADSSVSRVTVSAIDYTVRADSTGAIRLLDVSVGARAKISVFKAEEIQVVTDAYSTEYEIENEIKRIEARCLTEQFEDTCLCRNSFSATGKQIGRVFSLSTGDIVSSVTKRENKVIISGSVRAGLTVEYTNGEKGYIEKPLEFEYSRAVNCEDLICEKSVRVNSSSFLVTSQTNVDVRVEVEINASVFEKTCLPLITDIKVKEDCKKASCRAALTLYYPDRNESVWDIAKKYNTTVKAITEENSVSDENIEPGMMLILPRM